MAKSGSQLFTFDPESGRYIPVPKPRFCSSEILVFFVSAAVAVAIIVVPLYLSRESARLAAMRATTERLGEDYLQLLDRTVEMTKVLDQIAERDDNFYRVLLQLPPVPYSQRYAGFSRRFVSAGSDDALSGTDLASAVAGHVDLLEHMLFTQSKSFDTLKAEALRNRERIGCIPAIQPVADKDLRAIVSGFGSRSDPLYGISKPHEGIDYSAPDGTPIYATGKGRVDKAGWVNGYGYTIDIDHGFGYLSRYAHLSAMDVAEGQVVRRGQRIGAVGSTGKSTGPHLHYEVRYMDVPVDPAKYYFMDLTPVQFDEMIHHAQNAVTAMD